MSGRSSAVIGTALAAGGLGAVLVTSADRTVRPGLVIVAGLLVAWSFVGVGVYARERRPDSATGTLMCAVGFAWLLSGLTLTGTSLLYTVGLASSGLWYAVLAHMLLAFPSGRLTGRAERRVVYGAYAVAIGGQLVAMPFFAPASAMRCPCPRNVLMIVRDDAAAHTLVAVAQSLGVALMVAVAVVLVRRWRAANAARRRALSPVLGAGALVIVLLGVFLALDTGGSTDRVARAVLLVALVALAAVPVAFVLGLARSHFFHAAALGSLVRSLDAVEGSDVRDALADALDDPSLALLYWLPARERYVDADGCCVDVRPGPGRALTELRRGDRRVGAIVHAVGTDDDPALSERVIAATALALENDALHVELRARVSELERTRADVLAAGDVERRRLERDLHDGAQQRLVALRVQLGHIRERLADDRTGLELVDEGRSELDDALDDLRQLARGLHPALLSTRGLSAAVRSLASRAPLRVRVLELPTVSLPVAIESAAYFITAEALTNVAKHAEANTATVRMTISDGALAIAIDDDGRGGADPRGGGLRGLSARVAALDGHLSIGAPAGGGTRLEALIPIPPPVNGASPTIT